jgi:hypothetical protein
VEFVHPEDTVFQEAVIAFSALLDFINLFPNPQAVQAVRLVYFLLLSAHQFVLLAVLDFILF